MAVLQLRKFCGHFCGHPLQPHPGWSSRSQMQSRIRAIYRRGPARRLDVQSPELTGDVSERLNRS